MKEALLIILGVVITGIAVLLCFSCIYLAGQSDKYWDEIKRDLEKDKDEGH